MLTGIRHKAVLVLGFVLLALVGDSADGIPGIPRWGAKASAHILGRYVHIERIPVDESEWVEAPRGAEQGLYLRASKLTAKKRCCTSAWPLCAWMCPCPSPWRTSIGAGYRGLSTMSSVPSWGSSA